MTSGVMRKATKVLALMLAVAEAMLVIFGASQQGICSPAGTGCTSPNYAPGYAGMVVLAAAIAVTFASSRSEPGAAPTKSGR